MLFFDSTESLASLISFFPDSTAPLNSFIPLPNPFAKSGNLFAPNKKAILLKILILILLSLVEHGIDYIVTLHLLSYLSKIP